MKKKLKIGVLFGGKSAEHEVSIMSAKNVTGALDKNKYQIFPVKISRNGEFNLNSLQKMDVIFPVLHGPFGEDGSMQGLLKILNLPFVGPGVLGSAVSMDKDIMKRLFREAKISIGKFVTIYKGEKIPFKKIAKTLGLPVFVKPVNMGSSVGIHKVKNEKEWKEALKDAFQYDSKIIVEEAINGKEIECSVLGNEHPVASLPGEIIANQEFYSYDAKYIDQGSITVIPAKLDKNTIKKIQDIAVKAFKVLDCEGMGRVDFFVRKNGEVLVNEINTIPGFTNISMYPKLWEASGLPFKKLLDKLINLAIGRFKREQKLKTTVS
ncbi:D-alanine--D-alanine ligase A [Candidatus Nomurabacteria bacterium RIFCSPHIGHO2_02_FULL_35_13]|uniref:D-alanine--D-alanine ligase n=1 Tax=Candidatus Nomurabacteria bacterium RIFCSPHIGHO2_02_FULL_35_13 TaxID=1801748 RepID=A0A1F6VQ24_9BACT|nr:MAG: D-alanine--D-alanine ligase A [Candidatus Nomurabacteria bacterium RIFCSPHIGHO2_02_FULL_35_13]